MLELDAKGKRVLFISDAHIPYNHIDILPFLKAIKKKYKITKYDLIINLGDEADFHAQSYHQSDPDLNSSGDEYFFTTISPDLEDDWVFIGKRVFVKVDQWQGR